MPADACQYYYECTRWGNSVLRPEPGDQQP